MNLGGNETEKCECCRGIPSAPSPNTSRLGLVKQLNLFLELEAMLSGNSELQMIDSDIRQDIEMNQNEDDEEDDEDQNDLEIDNSNDFILKRRENQSIDRNNNKNEQDDVSILYMDSQVDKGKESNVSSINLSREAILSEFDDTDDPGLRVNAPKLEKLRPLIPSYCYSDLNEPLIGREWVFKEIEKGFETSQICVLSGRPGSGKTKLVQHLFRNSSIYEDIRLTNPKNTDKPCQLSLNLAGIHFCLGDDSRSLEPGQFVHNLAWSLTNIDFNLTKSAESSKAIYSYKQILAENGSSLLKKLTNEDACKLEPEFLLKKYILEPLESLVHNSKIDFIFVVIDSLDIATELSEFFVKNFQFFPKWIKFLITVRNEEWLMKLLLSFHSVNLDKPNLDNGGNFNLVKDINEYIIHRIHKSTEIQKNILYFNCVSSPAPEASINKIDSSFQQKFVQYLNSISNFSFLFVKQTLDLIEKGSLVIKSANFKVLPRSLDELFKLCFNLKFSSRLAYERLACHIFSACLASPRPLTLDEIHEGLTLAADRPSMTELLDQVTGLDGFLVSFNYYDGDLDIGQFVKTPLYTFSHAALRDWWLEFHTNCPPKQIYEPRFGHFLLASRLFRSLQFNDQLRNLKPAYKTRSYLELVKHLIKSSSCISFNSNLDLVVYLLSLYLPVSFTKKKRGPRTSFNQSFRGLVKPIAVSQFYTELLVSSEFLSSPDIDTFRVLLRLGASPTAVVPYFNNIPLICALARMGHVALLRELASLDSRDSNGMNALCYATKYGHIECAKIILERSTEPTLMVSESDSGGMCALTYSSVESGSIDLFELFLRKLWDSERVSVTDKTRLSQQALVLSAANGNLQSLVYLLSRRLIEVDRLDCNRGDTALTAACSNGHKAICEFLVETVRASINIPNSKSWTPLLCAVKAGEWQIVEYLLGQNLDIIVQADKHGRDSLILAASEGHLVIIDILIEKGASVTSQDRDGLSALSWACLKGHYNAALTLLDSGVNVNHSDYSGRTPLDLATFYGDVRLVQLLLDRGAQIEHADNIGMRPLDRAIGCRNVPIVVCFLKKGAKLGPATWAMAAGKPEIIITLLNKLVEDGNTLYRKGCYLDALHRYSYTLKKFPKDPKELAILPDNVKAIVEMKFNLLLNLARCHRKLQEFQTSVELCTKAIDLKKDSYEAFYSRARAKRDLKQLESALEDLDIAASLCQSNNDIKKLINKINEELSIESSFKLNKDLKQSKNLKDNILLDTAHV